MTEINAELVAFRLDSMAKDIAEIKTDIRAIRTETQEALVLHQKSHAEIDRIAGTTGGGNKVAAATVGGAVSAVVVGITMLIEYIRNIK